MAEHKIGSMDISEQEKTFDGFIKFATWVTAISIGVVIFIGLVNG
ncbi:MAG: aa3-type cytochrome c oxidase subunit IV [Pseudomonadota bacterium]|jgi:Ni,Fe-hydrogenase I cytochrome b subunit|nr:aa3-type cytochrome c oxidase subunit IV [Pseudomonadota bacterium]